MVFQSVTAFHRTKIAVKMHTARNDRRQPAAGTWPRLSVANSSTEVLQP